MSLIVVNGTVTASQTTQDDIDTSLRLDTTPQLGGNLDVNNFDIRNATGTTKVSISGLLYPNADGTANQVLATDGNGNLFFKADTDTGLQSVEDDTAPALGGDLDLNTHTIEGDGRIFIDNDQYHQIGRSTTFDGGSVIIWDKNTGTGGDTDLKVPHFYSTTNDSGTKYFCQTHARRREDSSGNPIGDFKIGFPDNDNGTNVTDIFHVSSDLFGNGPGIDVIGTMGAFADNNQVAGSFWSVTTDNDREVFRVTKQSTVTDDEVPIRFRHKETGGNMRQLGYMSWANVGTDKSQFSIVGLHEDGASSDLLMKGIYRDEGDDLHTIEWYGKLRQFNEDASVQDQNLQMFANMRGETTHNFFEGIANFEGNTIANHTQNYVFKADSDSQGIQTIGAITAEYNTTSAENQMGLKHLSHDGATSEELYVNGAQSKSTVPFVVPSYTVANLPTNVEAGAQAFCTNETGGSVIVFYDGTNWRRCTDRAVAS